MKKAYITDDHINIRVRGKLHRVYSDSIVRVLREMQLSREEFNRLVENHPIEAYKKIIGIMAPDIKLEGALNSEIILWGTMCLKKIRTGENVEDMRFDYYQKEVIQNDSI